MTLRRLFPVVTLGVVQLLGCSDSGAERIVALEDQVTPTVTWEQFLAYTERTAQVINGEKIYIVEWDVPIREDQLYSYYEAHYLETSKSTVLLLDDGADNKWTNFENLALTYCVSTSFGSNYARMQAEMAAATRAWMRAANVRFIYKSSEDGSCNQSNSAVVIPVQPSPPWPDGSPRGGACAFNPVGGNSCSPAGRALIIDIADIDSWPTDPWFVGDENMTTEGELRHELGHILGLAHEHIREADNAVASCNEGNWSRPHRALTAYDDNSVMHYPWCDGTLLTDHSITLLDRLGAIKLYGLPPAVQAALM